MPAALRRATLADVGAITELVRHAYGHYVSRIGREPGPMTEDYAVVMETRQVTVAEDDGRTVGVLVAGPAAEGFLLDNVAVHPDFHGRGIGRLLLEFAESEAKQQGFDSIYLYTHERMTENQALYRKIGYQEYARRLEKGLHRVYMRKALGR